MDRNLRESFYLLWMIAIILCAFAALFAALFVSFSKAPAQETMAQQSAQAVTGPLEPVAAPTPEPTPELTPEPVLTVLAETQDMGWEYLSQCVFLGDSTTYGLAAYDALPFTQVWSTSSGTMNLSDQSYSQIDYYGDDGSVQQMPIADAAARRAPEYLIITLGLNGISYMDEDEFKTEYVDLIQRIQEASPGTKIICQSIFPVIDGEAPSEIGNDRINAANEWVKSVSAVTGTRYLNTHEALTDESGNLRDSYCNGDGIHLDYTGCDAVLQYVRTHGYQ